MNIELVRCLFYSAAGYLSGGIMYAYWLPRLLRHVDVRDFGEDHNPGGFNAVTACGLPLGIACIVLDILKGTLPVLLAVRVGGVREWFLVPVVLAPVMGHAWPLLHRGQGGKCISVSFGVLIGLLPELLLAVIWAVFYVGLLPFVRDHRVLTQLSSLLLLVAAFVVYPMAYVRAIAGGVVSILQIKHRRKTPAAQEDTVGPEPA